MVSERRLESEIHTSDRVLGSVVDLNSRVRL